MQISSSSRSSSREKRKDEGDIRRGSAAVVFRDQLDLVASLVLVLSEGSSSRTLASCLSELVSVIAPIFPPPSVYLSETLCMNPPCHNKVIGSPLRKKARKPLFCQKEKKHISSI